MFDFQKKRSGDTAGISCSGVAARAKEDQHAKVCWSGRRLGSPIGYYLAAAGVGKIGSSMDKVSSVTSKADRPQHGEPREIQGDLGPGNMLALNPESMWSLPGEPYLGERLQYHGGLRDCCRRQ